MQDQQPLHNQPTVPHRSLGRRIPVGIMASLSAVVLAAGGGAAYWTWNSVTTGNNQGTPTAPTTTVQAPEAQQQPAVEPAAPAQELTQAEVYWLDVAGNRFELVPHEIDLESVDQPSDALRQTFQSLLRGPAEANEFSEIPSGTKLLRVTVESDGVHVNLSDEFTVGGGTASMTGRLAQVIYTATSLDPTAPVWIAVEGEPLEVLGGEGLMVDQPMTRAEFEREFSL